MKIYRPIILLIAISLSIYGGVQGVTLLKLLTAQTEHDHGKILSQKGTLKKQLIAIDPREEKKQNNKDRIEKEIDLLNKKMFQQTNELINLKAQKQQIQQQNILKKSEIEILKTNFAKEQAIINKKLENIKEAKMEHIDIRQSNIATIRETYSSYNYSELSQKVANKTANKDEKEKHKIISSIKKESKQKEVLTQQSIAEEKKQKSYKEELKKDFDAKQSEIKTILLKNKKTQTEIPSQQQIFSKEIREHKKKLIQKQKQLSGIISSIKAINNKQEKMVVLDNHLDNNMNLIDANNQ